MSVSNESKSNVTVVNEIKPGSGWLYDQVGLTYDGQYDPITGMPVYYDGIGTLPVFTNENKNNVTFSNESKNNV